MARGSLTEGRAAPADGDSWNAFGIWARGAFRGGQTVEDGGDGQAEVSARNGPIKFGVRGGRWGEEGGPDHAAYGGRSAWGQAGVRIGIGGCPGVDDLDVRGVQTHGGLADDGHGQSAFVAGAEFEALVAFRAGRGPGSIRSKRFGASAGRGRSSFRDACTAYRIERIAPKWTR